MAIWLRGLLRPYVLGAMAAATIGSGLVATQIKPVTIEIQKPQGKRDIKLWTFRQTVQSILTEAHVNIFPHDKISQALGSPLRGTSITIKRAIPVMVNTAHRHIRYWTTDYTVAHILSALAIKLGPMDQVKPSLHSTLSASGSITVIRRWLVKQKLLSAVPYSVQYRPDPNLIKGHSHVEQQGKNGQKEIVKSVTMQNGVAAAVKMLSQKLLKPPTPEIVAMGTANPPLLASRGGAPAQFERVMPMVATGYWPNPSWSDGITATGTRAQYGVVAVDPRVIPLGTHLYVPGYGFAVAGDTGGAIIGDRIDLCFNNGSQAVDWGVRQVEVYIVK